jgi:hypothetical protein
MRVVARGPMLVPAPAVGALALDGALVIRRRLKDLVA